MYRLCPAAVGSETSRSSFVARVALVGVAGVAASDLSAGRTAASPPRDTHSRRPPGRVIASASVDGVGA